MGQAVHSRRSRAARIVRTWVVWLLVVAVPSHASTADADATRNVLVIYSDNRLLPANIEIDRALREAIVTATNKPVEVYSEFLDQSRFAGDAYDEVTGRFLREKYSARMPDAILVAGYPALRFALRDREHLFAHVPVVFVAVSPTRLGQVEPLPHDVIGVPVQFDYLGTIEQALRFHPNASRLVLVTGASPFDLGDEARLRSEVTRLSRRVDVEHLARLPTAAVTQRLAALRSDTIVFTPGYFTDGAGRDFNPRDAAAAVAAASNAPVYGPFNTFIGTGIVGGIMPSFDAMGRQAAAMVGSLLDGTPATALAVPPLTPNVLQLDWRQAQRWGITDDQIPRDAIVYFKEPTFWDAYGNFALIAVAIVLLQGALIAALLYERRLQQRTAAALAMSERRMVLAARTARLSNWIWSLSPDTTANGSSDRPAAVGQTPLSKEPEVVNFADVLSSAHPADRDALDKAVRRAAEDDAEFNVEYRVVQRNNVRWFAARGRLEPGGDPRLRGVAIDITQRKKAELQAEQDRIALSHMTRVSLLGQLSASIAHQLNQPLAAMLSNAEAARKMLSREDVDLVELRAICDDIVTEDHRASQVIRRLSALYKRGEREVGPVDMNDLIRETLGLLNTELVSRHVAAITDLAPALPTIEGERVQLQQVVLNLIVNAADSMAATEEQDRMLTIRTAADDTSVRIDVIDRGHGIGADELAHLFDMFWSTKPGGMGIGLAICQSITAAHGGNITAANNTDRGATFSVVLPVHPI